MSYFFLWLVFMICFIGLAGIAVYLLRWCVKLHRQIVAAEKTETALREEGDDLFDANRRLREHIEKRDKEGWLHEPVGLYPEVPSVGKHALR